MHLESALESIGGLGRGQFFLVLLICLLRTNISLNQFSYTVVSRDLDYRVVYADGSESNVSNACPEHDGDFVFFKKAPEAGATGLVNEWTPGSK